MRGGGAELTAVQLFPSHSQVRVTGLISLPTCTELPSSTVFLRKLS